MSDHSALPFDKQLEQLLAVSNTRRRKTVVALVKVLDELRTRGTKVFSLAIVGKECEQQQLLTTQYIRNANGAPLRRLIEAYREKHGLRADSGPVRRLTPLEEAINNITDLDMRMRLLALIDDNKALLAQLRRMEQGFKQLSVPAAPASSTTSIQDVEPEAVIEVMSPTPVPAVNVRPLDRFISAEWLDQNAWTISEAGTIMDGRHAITPPGFVPSLKAALQSLSKGDNQRIVISDG